MYAPKVYISKNDKPVTGITVNKPIVNKTATSPKEKFSPGDRVKHITFGEGEVLSVKPMGADVMYEVMFDTAGTKKMMGTYAKMKKI